MKKPIPCWCHGIGYYLLKFIFYFSKNFYVFLKVVGDFNKFD